MDNTQKQVEYDEFGIPTAEALLSMRHAPFTVHDERFKNTIRRRLTETEKSAADTMASEHASYGSSRFYLKTILPASGPNHFAAIGSEAASAAFYVNKVTITLNYSSESHNWPSFICAPAGAATGTGGNQRDNIVETASKVDAVFEARRQGHPDFNTKSDPISQHTDETTRGIADYANAMGIPHGDGSTKYHPGFAGNNLVNVMAFSVAKRERLMRNKVPALGKPEDYVAIYVGKASDNTGLGGVIGASQAIDMTMTDLNEKAVQDPDPHLQEAETRAIEMLFDIAIQEGWKDRISIKDMGGAGLLCSTVEQLHGYRGITINGDLVPQNRDWDSNTLLNAETQERFMIIVHRDYAQKVLEVFNEKIGLPFINKGARAQIVGRCNDTGRYIFVRNGVIDVDLPHEDLAAGPLQYRHIKEPKMQRQDIPKHIPLEDAIQNIFGSINFKNDAYIHDHYDKHVRSTNIVNRGEGCATLRTHPLFEGKAAYSASFDSNPVIGMLDPKLQAEDSFVRGAYRMAAVGCSVIGVTNNANYGRTTVPEEMWEFVEGQRGIAKACYNWELEQEYLDMIMQDKEIARKLQEDPRKHVTVNSGNCSLNKANANTGTAIPPTTILGLVGWTNTPHNYATWDLKNVNSRLFLIGSRQAALGATDYLQTSFGPECIGNDLFTINYEKCTREVDAIIHAVRTGYISAANAIEEGGLCNAVGEMVANTSKPFNVTVYLDAQMGPDTLNEHHKMFSESPGVVLQVADHNTYNFTQLCAKNGVSVYEIGDVVPSRTGDGVLQYVSSDKNLQYSQSLIKELYDSKLINKLHGGDIA
ncbi:MAG: hypothetical protein HY514_03520 [Candidatus Aenigmarchaeota archaeon]|nr:hypothetical protein [Candidatus Aenigmarchaeota archaeon]